MADSLKKWLIVFNGEVYNHLELRRITPELQHHRFRTQSDTETLVEGFTALGPSFFELLEGEYAFVILAQDGTRLIAHRDAAGVKPLFFSLAGVDTAQFAAHRQSYEFVTPELGFASEMKGLFAPRVWDREGLCKQFVGLYEPIRTPFRSIIAMAPGGVLDARRNAGSQDVFKAKLTLPTRPLRFFDHSSANLGEHPSTDSSQRPIPSPTDFLDVLRTSVEERLLSDVELGVYLSGGVDSRAVAALLAGSPSGSRFGRKAFTVGFESRGFDETNDALLFARSCGFESHVLTLSDDALRYAYPQAVAMSENVQPYTNGAAKWWLSAMTKQHVRGVLTGDGADEMLCGYPSYRYTKWWMHAMRARGNRAAALKHLPLGSLQRDMLYANAFSSHTKDPWMSGSSAQGLGLDFVDSLAAWGVAHPLQGQISALAGLLLGGDASEWLEAQGPAVRSWFLAGFDPSNEPDPADPQHALSLWQNYFFRTHLPVQVVNWVGDRMEMANTLEGRTPYLSRRVRDFVGRLPDRSLIHGFEDKWILRRALASIVPPQFSTQPKKQFGAPFLLAGQQSLSGKLVGCFDEAGLDGSGVFDRVQRAEHRLASFFLKSGSQSEVETETSMPSGGNLRLAEARYEHSALNQFLQTSESMAIVNQTLVKNIFPVRDKAFEKQILATEQVFSP
jgi:asparagine synthase (glutamine-hydrolysing)